MAAETLTYHGTEGRVAEYRLTVTATGEQESLGVQRPINVELKYVLREQVQPTSAEGNYTVQLSGQVVSMKDKTSAFGSQRFDLPPMNMQLSPRGEMLSSAFADAQKATLSTRAFTSLLAQPPQVILPEGPVEVGATWEWSKDGATQSNRLQEILESPRRIARIATAEHTPVALHEASMPLGLHTEVAGQEDATGTMDFSPELGLALRHQGKSTVQADTKVTLEAADGTHSFSMHLNLRITFDLQLLRVDGTVVPSS